MVRTALLLALLPLLAPAQVPPKPPPSGVAPAHVRLTWHAEPRRKAIVSWSTAEAGREHRVRIRRRDAEPGEVRELPSRSSAPFRDDAFPLHFHHVHLGGLEPDTEYVVTVHSDGERAGPFWFRTAPDDDRDLVFLSGGDSRSDPATRRVMNRVMARLLAERPEILCLAHGGDYVASGRDLGQWRQWLSDHEWTTTESGRLLPVIPARGNHEAVGPLYDDVFATPGGGEGRNYFSTLLSPSVLLVTLNTNIAAGGRQRHFLEATLTQHAELRWKCVQYHRPIYPGVKSPARAGPHWLPVFERLGVHLALENDGHVLKRTMPIRDGKPAEDGIVYIGEGGLGVKQRRPRSNRFWLEEPGMARGAHHVWVVTLEADHFEVEAIGEDGTTIDRARHARHDR